MFTGIITDIGTVRSAEQRGDLRLVIGCSYDMDTVALGASIACSGACLTIVDKGSDWFAADLSAETVARTASGLWEEGASLNLERALRLGDELGGHFVTGHVDEVGEVVGTLPEGDSLRVGIAVSKALAPSLAIKGSVTVDGVSLTINDVRDDLPDLTHFAVNVIPHTAEQTTLRDLAPGRKLNIEIDVLARYLQRMVSVQQ